jgi:hypothetical protein
MTMTMAWIAEELNAGLPQTLWRALWASRKKAIKRGTDPLVTPSIGKTPRHHSNLVSSGYGCRPLAAGECWSSKFR